MKQVIDTRQADYKKEERCSIIAEEAAGEEDDGDEAVAGLTQEEREWFKNSDPLPMVEGPCISQVLLNHPDSKCMRQMPAK